jgi:hypothetical protein
MIRWAGYHKQSKKRRMDLMHGKDDSLIEKLAAANKLKAAPVERHVQASKVSAATPPAFLTKESAQSLFGLKTPVQFEPTIIVNAAEEPDNYARLLVSEPASEVTELEATSSQSGEKLAALAPTPTHEELLKEIQKLELLGDKKQTPEPVVELVTATEAARATQVTGPSWRSWLMPIAVAFAGIACISILPKAPDMPDPAMKPAAVQNLAQKPPSISTSSVVPASGGTISSKPNAEVAATVAESTPAPVAAAQPTVTSTAVEVVPTAKISSAAAEAPNFVVRKTETTAKKVPVQKKATDPITAKQKAEEAVALARASAPKTVQSKNPKTQAFDNHAHSAVANNELPKVPVVALATPAAVVAPVVASNPSIVKGSDQCTGMIGMAAAQCRQCSTLSFLRRLSCEGQVRVKYCEGREGMVSDCPMAYDTKH